MSLPPTPAYPTIDGQPCGARWTSRKEVTGKLPGTSYGTQFSYIIEPIVSDREVVNQIAWSGADLEALLGQIDDRIFELEDLIAGPQPPSATDPGDVAKYGLTRSEQRSLRWLLSRARAYLLDAEQIWNKWADRPDGIWPLDREDTIWTFSPECYGRDGGEIIEVGGNGRSLRLRCPTYSEYLRRPQDRQAIASRISDALAHTWCAEYGYWKLRTYKDAVEGFERLPGSQIGDLTLPGPEPEPAPGPGYPGGLATPTTPVDPCRDFAIGCPPGQEPDPDLGECPVGFCPETPDEDPGVPPPAPEGFPSPLPPEGAPVPADPPLARYRTPILVAGAGTLLVTGITFAVLSR